MPKYEKNFYIATIIILAIFIGVCGAIKSNDDKKEIASYLSPNPVDISENSENVKLKLIPTSVDEPVENYKTNHYDDNLTTEIMPVNDSINSRLIDVSIKEQRVRVYDINNKLVYTFMCSTSSTGILMPPGEHPDEIHDNIGTYQVMGKEKNHWSKTYQCHMPWALHYHGGHYIHATDKIKELGRPASHGCVRLHPRDAKTLYDFVSIGDTVHIH